MREEVSGWDGRMTVRLWLVWSVPTSFVRLTPCHITNLTVTFTTSFIASRCSLRSQWKGKKHTVGDWCPFIPTDPRSFQSLLHSWTVSYLVSDISLAASRSGLRPPRCAMRVNKSLTEVCWPRLLDSLSATPPQSRYFTHYPLPAEPGAEGATLRERHPLVTRLRRRSSDSEMSVDVVPVLHLLISLFINNYL